MSSWSASGVFHLLANQDWPDLEVRKLQNHDSSLWFSRQLYLYPAAPLGLKEIIARVYQLVQNQAFFHPDRLAACFHDANRTLQKLIRLCQGSADSEEKNACLSILKALEKPLASPPKMLQKSVRATLSGPPMHGEVTINENNFESYLREACMNKEILLIKCCFDYLKQTGKHAEQDEFLLQYLNDLPEEKQLFALDLLTASCLLGRRDCSEQCLEFLKARKLTILLRTRGDFEIEIVGPGLEIKTAKVFSPVIAFLNHYFKVMLSSGLREASAMRVTILDGSPQCFVEMLDFIHGGSIHIHEDNVDDLLRLSEQYQEDRLKGRCERFLIEWYPGTNPTFPSIEEGLEIAAAYRCAHLQDSLTHLSAELFLLGGKYEPGFGFNEEGCALLGQYGMKLTSLDFSQNCMSESFRRNRIDFKAMDFLVGRLPNLTSVNLSGCQSIGDAAVENIIDRLSFLDALDISECHKVTDYGISKLARRHPLLLRSLNLSGCYEIGRVAIERLCDGMNQLTSLQVRNCPKVKNDEVFQIGDRLTNLHSLGLGGRLCLLTEHSLRHVVRRLTKLQSLDLTACVLMTNATLNDIASFQTNLRTLVLAECPSISNNGVVNIAKRLTRLESLSLSGVREIDNVALGAIEESLTKLRSLGLDRCTGFTASGLESLANHMSRLRELDLSQCNNVTGKVLMAIAKYSRRLEHLNLAMCEQVEDDGVRILAGQLIHLRRLNLENCAKLTDSAVRAIIDAELPLEHLNLIECKKISPKAIEDIKKAYPMLFIRRHKDGGRR